ncbi:hypothetical protein T10_9481 [Trichinella papuae]|uniref:Uncharacterized protein n=1 Tax=Trichinella papuae TaxID=268474 RepID=A0A0V1MH05_9BILA|nr:hypothetical protein T10_9481 [Trichinella papuae]
MLSVLLILAECYVRDNANLVPLLVPLTGRIRRRMVIQYRSDSWTPAVPIVQECLCRRNGSVPSDSSAIQVNLLSRKLGCIKLPGPLCEMVRHPAVPLNHRSALA